MTTKDKILWLAGRCKGDVTITINAHHGNNWSVREELGIYGDGSLTDDYTDEKIQLMQDNNMIEVHAYPDTMVGFYHHFSHDLDIALDVVIEAIQEQDKNRKQ